MGSCLSISDTAASALPTDKPASETQSDTVVLADFVLKKHRPGCNGMCKE